MHLGYCRGLTKFIIYLLIPQTPYFHRNIYCQVGSTWKTLQIISCFLSLVSLGVMEYYWPYHIGAEIDGMVVKLLAKSSKPTKYCLVFELWESNSIDFYRKILKMIKMIKTSTWGNESVFPEIFFSSFKRLLLRIMFLNICKNTNQPLQRWCRPECCLFRSWW